MVFGKTTKVAQKDLHVLLMEILKRYNKQDSLSVGGFFFSSYTILHAKAVAWAKPSRSQAVSGGFGQA